MIRRTLIFVPLFYILSVLQATFLVYFNIAGVTPPVVLISVILINLFERPQKHSGLSAAICGGFFLDIFSARPIGFYVLILLATSIFIKIILRKYVRTPIV